MQTPEQAGRTGKLSRCGTGASEGHSRHAEVWRVLGGEACHRKAWKMKPRQLLKSSSSSSKRGGGECGLRRASPPAVPESGQGKRAGRTWQISETLVAPCPG